MSNRYLVALVGAAVALVACLPQTTGPPSPEMARSLTQGPTEQTPQPPASVTPAAPVLSPTATAKPTHTPTTPPTPTATPAPTATSTASATVRPSLTPFPSATPEPLAPPPALPTATPVSEPEEPAGERVAGFGFVPLGEVRVEPGHPCPGCPHAPGYIIGNVFDAAGKPLCGVRVLCYNDWHRYPVVGTKGGGEYDVAVMQALTTWKVSIVDEMDQPLSPEVDVAFDPLVACWYRLDWQRVD